MRLPELLFVIALILYTTVIWTHKFKKQLRLWMAVVFGIALAADTIATIVVCVGAQSGWVWNFHTITGLASLLIMVLHFTWAVIAIATRGSLEVYFQKYSIYAWMLWLTAFLSGIPAPA